MSKTLQFKKAKRVLRRRCRTLITQLTKASELLIEGSRSGAKRIASKRVDETLDTTSGHPGILSIIIKVDTHTTALEMFCSHTHGCLVREWHSFLNHVFEQLVDYCLKHNRADLVTKGLNINLKNADFSTKAQLRDSIGQSLVEKFSSNNYPERLNSLRKTVGINSEALRNLPKKLREIRKLGKIIQKHVAVRNCLEHADSKVRERDLKASGYSGKKIPMIKADGSKHEFGKGDVISVSDKDVRELKEKMLKYTEHFEVTL